MITVKHNLPDFKAQMQELGRKFIPVARAASLAAARVFVKAVRRFAPKDTGRLRRAVVIKRARRVARGAVHYIVGIRQGASQQRIQRKRKGQKVEVNLDAFYWRFLEGGWIPRHSSNAMRGGRRTKALQRRRALASGAKVVRHPFIAPAFNSVSGKALGEFYGKLDEGTKKLT